MRETPMPRTSEETCPNLVGGQLACPRAEASSAPTTQRERFSPRAVARFAFLAAVALTGVLVADCGKPPVSSTSGAEAGRKILYWVDPMHPAYTSDKPGKAPDCGMDLVPVYAGRRPEPPAAPSSAGQEIELSPEEMSAAGVATARATTTPLFRGVRAAGTLGTDETRLVHIAARVAGRLDRLYLDFTGESVRRGAPIYAIYSPDLVASGRE